jgi:hypothetical protein
MLEAQLRAQRLADIDDDEDEEIKMAIEAARGMASITSAAEGGEPRADGGGDGDGDNSSSGHGSRFAATEDDGGGGKEGVEENEPFEMTEDIKYSILLRDAMRAATIKLQEKLLEELIRKVIIEVQKEKKEEVELILASGPEITDPWPEADRLNEAEAYIHQLGQEKVKEKRAIADRITYLI